MGADGNSDAAGPGRAKRRAQRRARLLRLAAAAILVLGAMVVWLGSGPGSPADVAMSFARDEGIPGGVVAWGRAGEDPRIAAFGTADAASGRPATPETRFLLASLSKPLTAAVILSLAEEGKLRLDDPLATYFPGISKADDARHLRITVRDLLRHSAGWDRDLTFDPVADRGSAERHLSLSPEDCAPIAEAMLAQPLQFRPGTAYRYSNLGYCWLGRLISRTTGLSYEAAVSRWLRESIGPHGFRLGFGETAAEARATPHLVDPSGRASPDPWSERELRVLGAAGGWSATAADYFRFASLPVAPDALAPPPYDPEGPSHYGLGWRVWPGDAGPVLSHFGAMPGAYSLVLRLPGDRVVVALFNARPRDDWQALARLAEGFQAAMTRD